MAENVTELHRLWSRILDDVKDQINDARIYDAFIGDSFLQSYEKNTLSVGLNSMLAVSLLSSKYIDIFNTAAQNATGNANAKVIFGDKDTMKVKEEEKENKEFKPEYYSSSIINPNETFDNFVVGPYNKAAQQAALLIASNPGKLYNPLFIYSNSGLGKTHLLFAIANYIKEKSPNRKVLYVTSDDFVSEFIMVVRGEDSGEKLKQYIASHDILLVDDIQIVAGKEQTEKFFFQVFTKMYNAGKQIVITSDKHPQQLKGFEERLVSRFQSGLTMEINSPDVATCVNILKSKINSSPINLESFDQEVLEFIAEKFSKNIRSIDEALHKLVFYTTSVNPTSHITMDVALEALQPLIDIKESKTKINEQKIINTVADYYSLTPSQITGRSRMGNLVLPRHICMYLIKEMLDVPYTKIGMTFSGKDHSTVMSGCKKVEKELKTNVLIQTAVNDIKKLLKS